MTENTIRTVKILRIVEECDGIKTFTFNMKNNGPEYIMPKPGQFVMIWVPGVDEVPMSISGCDDKGNWSITVKKVGECTNKIHNLKTNDFIGVRGPLGNYFTLPPVKFQKIFLIGGGIGMAPLRFLISELFRKRISFILIEGAKVKNELIFTKVFQKLDDHLTEIHYCTDDGSFGRMGFASETFENVLENCSEKQLSNAIACTCGPEIMMYKVFQLCEKYDIELQANMERIMRCGCGLCGLCAIDPLGLLVCKDGPIFNSELLRKMDDFGKNKRDFSGKKIPLD